MSDYFHNAYARRLNRYGYDYQSRILGQREKVFQNLLLKSIYRVDFQIDDCLYAGILEPYKQDETRTLQYLLTELAVDIPNGTIIEIENLDDDVVQWMIYWKEEKQNSGYHRYVVLKMSHLISWTDKYKNVYEARGYLHGKEDSSLKDTLQSSKVGDAVYAEPLQTTCFITPFNSNIHKDDYFEITTGEGDNQITDAYKVTGYDVVSSAGVEYVTLEPIHLRDNTPPPEKKETDKDTDFYWLNGGIDE